jgi:hypothetical protein
LNPLDSFGAKVPNLRFPGFEGEWENRKLREIATNKSLKFNPEKSTGPVKCIELEHLASIIQGLYKLYGHSAVGSTFVIFDVNGEYDRAFSNIGQYDKNLKATFLSLDKKTRRGVQKFTLPHWYLTIEEWALLLQASEKTQLPILRNALGLAPVFSSQENVKEIKNHILATCITQILRGDGGSASNKDRITSILQKFSTEEINLNTEFKFINEDGEEKETYSIDRLGTFKYSIRNCLSVHFGGMHSAEGILHFLNSKNEDGKYLFLADNFKMPVYQHYQKFNFDNLEDVIDLALLYEEAHGNKQIRDYNASLITRIKSLKDRPDFDFFRQDMGNIKQYKRKLLGLFKSGKIIKKTRQIINIDLSSIEDEIVEVISCVITRILYEAVKDIQPRNSFPINLILEEAHRYIGYQTQNNFLKANLIFERVAKEGRKFGLFLIVSSQRPSELSKTVLSQCSNFIVHRIQNPEDLSHIRQITPHVSETIMRRMPSIPTQNALIFGHCVNLPATFKVNTADPLPNSDNNKVSDNWFKQARHEIRLTKH